LPSFFKTKFFDSSAFDDLRCMVNLGQAENAPLLLKELKNASLVLGRGRKKKVLLVLGIALTGLAVTAFWRGASNQRRLVSLEEEDDDEFFGNEISMYATQCCSPKDISCCHTTASSAWIPGVAVVDISRRCNDLPIESFPSNLRVVRVY
jgi:hypothetical protein